jgi:hypothetical protein
MSPYDVRAHLMGGLLSVFDAIAQAPIPLVACVQGPTNNFGVTLAAACDITLASDKATFRYAEIEQGTPPTTAISVLTPNVSAKALAYLIYGAKSFDAQQALRCGLVTDVFPHDRFSDEAPRLHQEARWNPAHRAGEHQALSNPRCRSNTRYARRVCNSVARACGQLKKLDISPSAHWDCRPAPLITSAHLPRSLRTNCANSSGRMGRALPPMLRSVAATSGNEKIRRTSSASVSNTDCGVPAGAKNPCQPTASNPGTVSPMAGISGAFAARFAVVTPNARTLPPLASAQAVVMPSNARPI